MRVAGAEARLCALHVGLRGQRPQRAVEVQARAGRVLGVDPAAGRRWRGGLPAGQPVRGSGQRRLREGEAGARLRLDVSVRRVREGEVEDRLASRVGAEAVRDRPHVAPWPPSEPHGHGPERGPAGVVHEPAGERSGGAVTRRRGGGGGGGGSGGGGGGGGAGGGRGHVVARRGGVVLLGRDVRPSAVKVDHPDVGRTELEDLEAVRGGPAPHLRVAGKERRPAEGSGRALRPRQSPRERQFGAARVLRVQRRRLAAR
mmetsp:Transcript_16038/g.54021  ORF Transcript_16038/g.54021 Transcript_16038/m.54021 type:complete len:258 (-) Transcript_16038:334-1107(-)